MQRLTPEQKSLLDQQTTQFQHNLYVAAEYLEGRGITEDTAVSARLGVVDEEIWGDSRSLHRLSIPYLTRSGVVDIRLRCLREHDCSEVGCSKYIGRAGIAPRLYNVSDLVSAADTIAVTEGELDCLILRQLGFHAVGIPGAQSWKPHWGRLFEDFGRILVFVDGDSGGEKFSKAWQSRFPQTVELVQMGEGEDVNSMFLKEGEYYFRGILG